MATFIIGGALAGLGGEYEDAARLSGASPARAWLAINIPLLAPAIALSCIVIFAEVLSDFGMASTIALQSNFGVLTYGIYAAASDYPVDFPMAGAQALTLLVLILLAVILERFLRRGADARLVSGRSKSTRMYDLGNWRWVLTAVMLLIAFLSLYLPLMTIVGRALTRTLGAGLSLSNFTAENLARAIEIGTPANNALLRSLGYAGATAAISCVIALLLCAQLDRASRTARMAVLSMALGAIAIPGIVLGFGYILVWNRLPGFASWPFPHYGDASLLITGYVSAALPYCLVVILSAVGQLAPSLNDAARLHGISPATRLLRITLPLVFISVLTAFLLTFIRTVFELPISQLLIPVSGTPVPPFVVRLFNHDNDGQAAALSLVSMLVSGGIAGLIWIAARRHVILDWRRGEAGTTQPIMEASQ
jgi:iron(III) transport system permease protein